MPLEAPVDVLGNIFLHGSWCRYLKPLGTYESYYEAAGYDAGRQAGNYLSLTGLKKWEKRPGLSAKMRFLNLSFRELS
jgi:hypothetical protein